MAVARFLRLFRSERGDFAGAALSLPLFLFVIFGGVFALAAWNAKDTLTLAAREGARLAAVGASDAQVRQRAAEIVAAHGVWIGSFDPAADVVVARSVSGDPTMVAVTVRCRVPAFVAVGRIMGGNFWNQALALESTVYMFREPL
jgi:hypothetical protein